MATSFQERIGRGTSWWNRKKVSGSAGNFLVFVEDAALVLTKDLVGPADTPVRLFGDDEQIWRFRTSGIAVEKFVAASETIKPVDPVTIDQTGRAARRDELLAALENVALPVIDILVPENDEALPFARAVLIPGAWYWIGVRSQRASDDRWPVFMDTPIPRVAAGDPASLLFIEAVPPYFEYRLRDIFSLAHIADADDGEEDRGGGEPADMPPGEPNPRYEVVNEDALEEDWRKFTRGLYSEGEA